SLTPLVLAHSSQRSTFCILSPAIWVKCTVASFSLQMQHNINGHFWSLEVLVENSIAAALGLGKTRWGRSRLSTPHIRRINSDLIWFVAITVCVKCTAASFPLQLQHNINSLLVYWLTGNFSQGPVLSYQFFCYRAGLAGSDYPPIDLHNGDQFSAGAGEKTFVGVEEIVAGQIWLADLQTGFHGHFHDHFASDSIERAG